MLTGVEAMMFIPTNEATLICDPSYDEMCPDTQPYGEYEEPMPETDRISSIHDMRVLLHSDDQEAALYQEHCCDDDDANDPGLED